MTPRRPNKKEINPPPPPILAGISAYLQSPRAKDWEASSVIVCADKIGIVDGKNRKVLDAANEDRFYFSLAASDAEPFAKTKKRLLWRTSMPIEAREDFGRALGTMLASGGPLFATSITDPVFIDDRDRRNADVKVGAMTVVEETPGDQVPVPKKKLPRLAGCGQTPARFVSNRGAASDPSAPGLKGAATMAERRRIRPCHARPAT